MKSCINPISRKGIFLFVLCATSFTLFGQAYPRIEARFTNPAFDQETRNYTLDVELTSKDSPELLFGMNLRFFYDASLLEYVNTDQFAQGYGFLGTPPSPAIGNSQSGSGLFSFSQAAGYINGGVQIMDERFPLQIPTSTWVKAFRVVFYVPITVYNPEQFCPSVIFDLEADVSQGGFLPGSAGLVITVAETNRSTRFESAPTTSSAVPFNWNYDGTSGLPHGFIAPAECMSIAELVATEEQDKTDAKGYALFQNQPNPFNERTFIEFVLPYAQHATITFYDVDGSVKEEVKGFYESGRNKIELKQKVWMKETTHVYYRLQTDKYTSKSMSMSLIRA
jgi:hypothetical protein